MCPANQVNLILGVEFAHNVLSKGKADSPVVVSPVLNLLLGVRPKQIAEQSCVWHIGRPHNVVYGQNFIQLRGESPMHAQDLVIYQRSNWQTVEAVCENFPQFDTMSTLALVIEAIDSVDGGTLVVTSEEEKVLWVLYLVG